MDSLTYLHVIAVLIAGGLAAIAIRAPHPLAIRAGAVVLAGLLMATGFAAFAELLGRPKPVTLEWATGQTEDAVVLAANIREGEAIFLWLKVEGLSEPRAYELPWSLQTARQLQHATRQAERKGTDVRVRGLFGPQAETDDRMFYAPPPPPLPPKLVQAP